MRVNPRFSAKAVLVTLAIVNVIAIGLSEIQRRSLVAQSIDMQRDVLKELRSLRLSQERENRLSALQAMKIDRIATFLLPGSAPEAAGLADPRSRDNLRMEQVKKLKVALDEYYNDFGVFPGQPIDIPVVDLSTPLVGGIYIDKVPDDPVPGRPYRYITNGRRYGLRVPLEIDGDCLTGVGAEGNSWWGKIRSCPF